MAGFGLLLGSFAAVGLALAFAWTSYLLADRLFPEAPTSTRWSAALVIGVAALLVGFWLAASVGCFRLGCVLPAWGLLAAAVHTALGRRPQPWQRLRADGRRLVELICEPGYARWLGLGVAIVGVARLLRALAAPPLAWDALTYHLVRAGIWIQAGGFVATPAPDAWGYYDWFPPGADVLWAWAMLPVRGDGLVPILGFILWLGLGLGTYTASRNLGGSPQRALLVALVVLSTPGMLAQVTAAYADLATTTLFALGAGFVIRLFRGAAAGDYLGCTLAFSAAVATKFSALIYLGLVLLVVSVALLKDRIRRARALWLASLLALVVAVGVWPYLRTWARTGSPFFPLTVTVPFLGTFPGSHELTLLLEGALLPAQTRDPSVGELLRGLFAGRLEADWSHLNLGLGGVFVLLAAGFGLIDLRRRPALRWPAVFLLVCAVLTIAPLASPAFRAERIIWWASVGRFLGPALVALALLTTPAERDHVDLGLAGAVVLSLFALFPLGFGPTGRVGAAILLLVILAVGLLSAFLVRLLHGRQMRLAALLVVVLALSGLARVGHDLRTALRYPFYAAAASGREFDLHPLDSIYAASWPAWRFLDREAGLRIAVTAGWDGIGHNWYRYPLLGSRLQNELFYIPVTADGTVIDYRPPVLAFHELDGRAWTRRLREEGIEYVVVLPPTAVPELYWMEQRPALFEPVARELSGASLVYRVVPPG